MAANEGSNRSNRPEPRGGGTAELTVGYKTSQVSPHPSLKTAGLQEKGDFPHSSDGKMFLDGATKLLTMAATWQELDRAAQNVGTCGCREDCVGHRAFEKVKEPKKQKSHCVHVMIVWP